MEAAYLNQLLAAAVKNSVSDIHLKVGSSPLFRLHGVLVEVKAPKLQPEDTVDLVRVLTEKRAVKTDVDALKELDTSYAVQDVGRFRVNIYRQKGTFAVVMRTIPFVIPTFKDLGLPPVLEKICQEERGLVLVTGVTGSGKTSTLAAMINYINETRKKHIVTIEDPVEFLHKDKGCSISQREIGTDTEGFAVALRAALRQDPDIILVGEMRDLETIETALKAVETGHLVFSTVHTTDASKTINRLLGVFPAEEQNIVRLRLAENLKATISQRLLPRKDGHGRVVAAEVMVVTLSIQEYIKNPQKTGAIKDHIEKGRDMYGSQSFDQHLSDLYSSGLISLSTAKSAATNPADFERALSIE